MARSRPLRIGTRSSKLARWQSDWVAAQLAKRGVATEIVEIATSGDVKQSGPVAALGVQGAFTKEIQAATLSGEVDLAVHSLKDLPTQTIDGLTLAAVPERENPADALVAQAATSLADLPRGARVGTGSVRRRAQLLHLRSDLAVVAIRGNVDTRLRKVQSGELDAVMLAYAGLKRLGWHHKPLVLLGPPEMLPAPGQGALAVECRMDDTEAVNVVSQLNNAPTRLAVTAERMALAALHGGCSAPIAAYGRVSGSELALDALVADVDGRTVLRACRSTTLPLSLSDPTAIAAAELLGRRVAEDLLAQGAAALVASARSS